jgi:hypothetical protein
MGNPPPPPPPPNPFAPPPPPGEEAAVECNDISGVSEAVASRPGYDTCPRRPGAIKRH